MSSTTATTRLSWGPFAPGDEPGATTMEPLLAVLGLEALLLVVLLAAHAVL